MKKYFMITGFQQVEFGKTVERYLEDGWKLHGTTTVLERNGVLFFAQAVVK